MLTLIQPPHQQRKVTWHVLKGNAFPIYGPVPLMKSSNFCQKKHEDPFTPIVTNYCPAATLQLVFQKSLIRQTALKERSLLLNMEEHRLFCTGGGHLKPQQSEGPACVTAPEIFPLGYLAMGKNVFSQINDMFIQKEVATLFRSSAASKFEGKEPG